MNNILVTGPPGVGKTTLITRVLERIKEALPSATLRGFTTEEVRREGERIGFDIVRLDGSRVPLARLSTSSFPSPLNHASHNSSASNSSGSSSSSRVGSRSSNERWGRIGKYTVDIAAVDSHMLPILSLSNTPPSFSPLPATASFATAAPVRAKSPLPAQSESASATVLPAQLYPNSNSSSSSGGSSTRGGGPRGMLWVVDEIGKMELLSPCFATAITALLDAPIPLLASIPIAMHGRDVPQVATIRARPDVSVVTVSRSNRDQLVTPLTNQLLSLIS